MTIPQQVATLIAEQPQTAQSLCVAIYGTCTDDDIAAMYTHVHRAKLIAPVVSVATSTGAKVGGKSVVQYEWRNV